MCQDHERAHGRLREPPHCTAPATERRSRRAAASRKPARLAAATAAWLIAFAALPGHADQRADLAHNRSIWKAAAIVDYEYGYNKYCACHPTNPPETLVTVRAGKVVRVRHRPVGYDREVEAPRGLEYYWTIDGLFDLIAKALDRKAKVGVVYDATLGYPTKIDIDYDPDLIGDEVDLKVTRLERLN